MGLFFRRHPSREEHARLRDELIVERTCRIFAVDMLASLKRRREPRKDKASIIAARKATTAQLMREVGR